MALLFIVAFVVLIVGMAATFVAVVTRRYRREMARRRSWSTLGARLGLRHESGDPLGLAARLGVTRVSQTLWGELDGARVAAITVTIFRPSGSPLGTGPTLSTFSGAVAQVDPPAYFDADTIRGWLGGGTERVQVSPARDLVLLVADRQGWASLHDPDDATTAERLLRRAAWVAHAAKTATR